MDCGISSLRGYGITRTTSARRWVGQTVEHIPLDVPLVDDVMVMELVLADVTLFMC
jgi:hypothetical protein